MSAPEHCLAQSPVLASLLPSTHLVHNLTTLSSFLEEPVLPESPGGTEGGGTPTGASLSMALLREFMGNPKTQGGEGGGVSYQEDPSSSMAVSGARKLPSLHESTVGGETGIC
jgi:hypothetical protein